MGDWTFFSNYGHVLVCLARDNEARLRDVAASVGITERAVQKIVRDLADAGYLEISKHGRCNRYRINRRKALRHALESRVTVGQLLNLIVKPSSAAAETAARRTRPEAAASKSPEVPESESVAEADSSRPARPRKKKSKKSDEEPLDTRQQGSLF